MSRRSLVVAAAFGFTILSTYGSAAEAAEVRVLSALGMRPVMTELDPQFERATGHKLVIQYELIGVLKRQIDAGERFDVAILTTPFMDDLVKQGKIAAAARTDIARSGLGVFVRTGAPKPDTSSADAFRRTMLNAKSISYPKEGATAIYLASLFERLGIAEQMQAKTRHAPGARGGAQFVADGEAELGLGVISAFEPVPGAEVIVPFPPELQNYVGYTGGIATAPMQAEAGRALLNFLTAPAAVPVLKAKGMEPITP